MEKIIGGGRMGDIIRTKDWSENQLGEISSWPIELVFSLNSMLNNPVANVLYWSKDHLLFFNDPAIEIMQEEAIQTIGLPIFEINPFMKENLKSTFSKVWKSKLGLKKSFNITADGYSMFMEFALTPIFSLEGEMLGVNSESLKYKVEAKVDPTEINPDAFSFKLTNESPTLSNDKLEMVNFIMDILPMKVWVCSTDGPLVDFNKKFLEYSGMKKKDLLGFGWLEMIHPDDIKRTMDKWSNAVSTGENYDIEHRFRSKTGDFNWMLTRAIGIRNEVGEIKYWMGTSTNIEDQKNFSVSLETQVKARTEELSELNKQLKIKNSDLSTFAHVSSHDLQEPLRKIQTFISKINLDDDNGLSPASMDDLNNISKSAKRMRTLIIELLKYASASESTYNTLENVDLNEEINQVLSRIDHQHLLLSIPEELPTIRFSKVEINHILQNIIGNAIKYKRKDKVKLEVTAKEIKSLKKSDGTKVKGPLYKISFKDNGIGFKQEYADQIFKPFKRLVDRNTIRGTGLGLSIVDKIMYKHKGSINAKSQEGKGTTFNLYFKKSK